MVEAAPTPPLEVAKADLLFEFGVVALNAPAQLGDLDQLTKFGLGVDDPVWDHLTFSKNRDPLLEGDIAVKFLSAVLVQPKVKRLLSSDHFSVDGTLIEASASIKSFRKKDRGDNDSEGPERKAERSFHKEKRSNETHTQFVHDLRE